MKVKDVLEVLFRTQMIAISEDVLWPRMFQGKSIYCPTNFYEKEVFQIIPTEQDGEATLLIILY